jgi:hypothetical protein
VAQASSAHAPLARNTVLSRRYRIEQLIGSGGYANVYRAMDTDLGYERAIKEVIAADPGLRKQFQLESELLINTKHPNIPQGYALFEDRGRMYLVMDYVVGKDLEEILNDSLVQRGRPLEEAHVLTWMIEICDALTVMHSLRVPIIHRDIKPANIKIAPDDRPVLIDFGLAKLHRQGSPTMTAAQGVSPGFAPPEQYMAKGRTDRRTDVYGLGATLYAALTGKDPPEAPARLLAKSGGVGMGGATLSPPRKWNPRISDATNRLILKALELSPNHRQQDASEMRRELEDSLAVLQGTSSSGSVKVPAMPLPTTGKRAAIDLPPAGGLSVGGPAKQPAMAGAASLGVTNRQAAIGGTAKQGTVGSAGVAPPKANSNKHRVAPKAPVIDAYPALPSLSDGPTGKRKAAPAPQTSAKMAAVATKQGTAVRPAVNGAAPSRAPGITPNSKGSRKRLGGIGKVVLALSMIEALWGVAVLLLGIYAAAHVGEALPIRQLALGWAIVALVVGGVGSAVLMRPIYRRGRLRDGRRIMQGIAIALYSIAVHAVAVYGLLTYRASGMSLSGPGMWVAVVAFVLFGLCVAFGGILAIVNVVN